MAGPAAAGRGARQHLLGAAAGRDQADADLDEPDVGFRRRLHAIAMQRHLAAAAEREPGRRDHDRHLAGAAPSSPPGSCGPSGRRRPSSPPAPRAGAASGWRRRRSSSPRSQTTSAANCARRRSRPRAASRACRHRCAFIFECSSSGEDAVAEIDQAGAGVARPPASAPWRRAECSRRPGGTRRPSRNVSAPAPAARQPAAAPARAGRRRRRQASPTCAARWRRRSRTGRDPSQSPSASRDRRRRAVRDVGRDAAV